VTESSATERDAGSVLMLVPAGILVLLVLAAVAIDSSVVFLAQRDLADRTAAASGDVANVAADDDQLYDDDHVVVLRQDVADAVVGLAFDPARPPRGYEAWQASAVVEGRSVTVSAEAEVRRIFAPAIPGVDPVATVHARSTAVAAGG
jgi:hypothetical protein